MKLNISKLRFNLNIFVKKAPKENYIQKNSRLIDHQTSRFVKHGILLKPYLGRYLTLYS